MANELKELVRKIAFHNKMKVADIAAGIGYSRIHLQKEMGKVTANESLKRMLIEKYGSSIQDVSRETKSIQDVKQKNPGDVPGLMKELIESQKARIKLLEERQQSETRLIQVEERLRIVAEILSDLRDQGQSRTPSVADPSVTQVKIQRRGESKSESNFPKAENK